MAIGMLVVGRAGGQLEPDERHDRAGRIRQVVDGVRRDGYAAGNCASQKLACKQQNIADDTHNSGQSAVFCTHGRVSSVLVVWNKAPQQKGCHSVRLFQVC